MFWYTDLIYAIHRLEEAAQKVTKNWSWPVLISHD